MTMILQLRKIRKTRVAFGVPFGSIRQVFAILVFLVSLVGMNPVPVLADSTGLVCESFDAYTTGSMVGSYAGWYDGAGGPVVTDANGVSSSVGLAAGSNIFNWTAHPFNWNDAHFVSITLQGDFQTSSDGLFDDDRLSWTINGVSTTSSNQFGVQLDHSDGGIVTYYQNSSNANVRKKLVALPTLSSNTWYRFNVEISKLTATSASIDVTLTSMDSSGNPTGVPYSGTITDTAALIAGERPNGKYFASSLVPSYKNFSNTTGAADNLCYKLVTGTTPVQYTLTVTNDGNGSVTLNPPGGVYEEGTVVTLAAVPHAGYEFYSWTGANAADLTDNGNGTSSITMNADKSLQANFAELPPSANKALDFGTGTAHVTFGDAPELNLSQFTLETWFKREGTGVTTTTGTGGVTNAIPLVTQGRGENENSNVDMNYFLGIRASDNVLFADFEEGAGGGSPGLNHPVIGVTPIVNNIWYHAAATYDGNKWQLFLNGRLEGELAVGQPVRSDSVQDAALGTGLNSNGVSEGHFDGVLDEVRIWNYARSQTDILNMINSEITLATSGLVGRWALDGDANGSAGTAVNGTLQNSGYSWVEETAPFNITTPAQHTLTVNTTGNGSVVPSSGTYYDGILQLTAVPAAGWSFGSWSGDLSGSTNPANITFNGDKTVTATFTEGATVTFQNGVGGYTGTVDTYLNSGAPTANNATTTTLIVDRVPEQHILLRFDNIFGSNAGQIPAGATIQSASLTLNVTNSSIQGALLHRMLQSWHDTDHWNTWGGGINANGIEAETTAYSSSGGSGTGTTTIEVTADLQAWLNNPSSNFGWAWLPPTGDDSWQLSSSEVTTIASRPKLMVSYRMGPVNEPPHQPSVVQPGNGALNASTSPTLEVTVSDPEDDPLNVTFYGRQAGTAEDFTIVVLPDTQFYSESYPSIFIAQTQWIVDNAAALNIEYVAHEGDIVNVAGNENQWKNADAAMDLLDAANIPYGVVPGNHDEGALYNTYFGVSRFTGKPFYGGEYPTGDNSSNYTLFSAGGMDFIVLNLDYTSPASGLLNWADGLLKTNSTRRAIVISHDIVGTGNPAAFSSWGSSIYNELKDNPNLFLMMNGHTSGEGQRTDVYNISGTDYAVYSLLADYQSRTNGGDAWLRILEFSPANNEIRVKTYSPAHGTPLIPERYETDADSQFILPYDMDGGAFESLGMVSAENGHASINWPAPHLTHDTQYEWYVDVSDGTHTTHGPIWNFTTVPPACYSLTVVKTGNGAIPVASPARSAACASDGLYVEGEIITLSGETPAPGWHLGSWYGTTEGGNSLIMPAAAHSAGINYVQDEYTLSVNINPAGSGAITLDNPGTYHYGDSVELTVSAVAGWAFTGWSGDLIGTDNPADIIIDGNKTVTANFTQLEYTLIVSPVGSGTVARSPDQTTYHYNDVVTLTPSPTTGWVFSNWGGNASGSANPLQVTIDGNKNVTATFTQLCYTLTTSVDPASGGSITADPAPNCDGGTKYTHGTPVILTAVAAPGYGFDQWSGVFSGSTNPQTITMDSDKTVTAAFALNAVSLTVNVSPSSSGSVTQNPSGPYFYGAEVTLTANPPIGWHFVEWTGSLTGSTNPALITMNGDKTVTAVFAKDPVTLTINIPEGGSVTKNPSRPYLYGDTVQLTAVPDSGWHFVQWAGALSGSANPAEIILNGDKTVTATFARNEYTLSVSVAPLGSGTVTRDLNQSTYLYGDVVTLTANANSGWSFTNWGADASGNTNPMSVTITGNTNIIADFTQTTITHSISLQPGWNLVSFNLHPLNTNIANVLSSIQGNYDLVYAWDATGAHSASGNWMKYDNIPLSPDTLSVLDETMGFWIHMTVADTLDVTGTIPAASNIALKNAAGGWNLVAYPSAANGSLPGVLREHGVDTTFSLVYAYHASDVADRWKLFDRTAPPFANDLIQLTPGWGYWIKVNADSIWDVSYAAP